MEYLTKTNDYIGISEPEYAPSSFLRTGKKSFLVFNRNKYMTVLTENIAFFYVKFNRTVFTTFDKQEYGVIYSLEQIQQLLPEQQFFRLNRQYLMNFAAIKEVELFLARKLLVVPTVSFPEKLLVSKEKARGFLRWMEER
jgi:DNA-binding LytR/AlgR family response regulator